MLKRAGYVNCLKLTSWLRKVEKYSLNPGKFCNVSIRRICAYQKIPKLPILSCFHLQITQGNEMKIIVCAYNSQVVYGCLLLREGEKFYSVVYLVGEDLHRLFCLSYPFKIQTLSNSWQITYLLSASLFSKCRL